MDSREFIRKCKGIVAEYFNKHVDKTEHKNITVDDVYVVWSCKVLQNNKAPLSTNVPDGMYFEITYNGDREETYIDVYKKLERPAQNGVSFNQYGVT